MATTCRILKRLVTSHSSFLLQQSALWVIMLAVLNGAARAQEVRWRYDYNQARREALEKSRPLLLDFGTENCFWCKKLDATTFRDPAVVQVLNEQFIPLKVDANRDAPLTDLLRIQSFPTLVLAASDGKILTSIEGYVEVARLHEQLQRILASVGNPEWMTRDYEAAVKAIAAADYSQAIVLLKGILEDGKDRPVQVKAGQLVQDLEQQAATRLARVKQLQEKGEAAEAMPLLSELARLFPGTRAALEGGRLLANLEAKPEVRAQLRSRKAADMLAQARADYRSQQYLCCLDRCEQLASGYADLPEGAEAIQLAAEIKSNPEWMHLACENLADRLSGLYLALAETWLKRGQPQHAVPYLERVVQSFPGTRQAETAQLRLAQVQGRTAWQTESRKP
jgi:thioredoxin-related protein